MSRAPQGSRSGDPDDEPNVDWQECYEDCYRAWMACYDMMVSGPRDGWVATHSSGVYKHEAFLAGSSQMMTSIFLEPVTINVAEKFLGWEFEPVKLVRVEG